MVILRHNLSDNQGVNEPHLPIKVGSRLIDVTQRQPLYAG